MSRFGPSSCGAICVFTDPNQERPKLPRSTNLYLPMPPSGSIAWISVFLASSSQRAGVYLRLAKGGFAQEAYRRLEADREQIDRELGIPVEWEADDGSYKIATRTPVSNLADEAERNRVMNILAEHLDRFVSVFRHRLKTIEERL